MERGKSFRACLESQLRLNDVFVRWGFALSLNGMGVIRPPDVPIEMHIFIDTVKYFYREPFIFSSPALSKSTLFTLFSYM